MDQINKGLGPYEGLEPSELWQHFAALNRTPRCSGRESAARAYVQRVAEAAGTIWKIDKGGNIVVYSPPKGTDQSAPSVAVQAHLDMVCDKELEIVHDFREEPIRPRREDDRIFASGTTLGADNGIGVAAALALLTQPGLRHGPLELIFTVEEETGLCGALALDSSLLHARWLINLDSEDPNVVVVGCAGGEDTVIRFLPVIETIPVGQVGREVVISGLRGGHSGLQIHEGRANAVKLLTSLLVEVQDAGVDFCLASIKGGSAGNAIPRFATALLSIAPDTVPELEVAMVKVEHKLRTVWGRDEPGLSLEVREVPAPCQVMASQSRDGLLWLLQELPHGVLAMSRSFPGKVKTSSNLGYVHMQGSEVVILTSSRSFDDKELKEVQSRLRMLGEAVGASVQTQGGYPGWEPDPHSQLLNLTEEAYRKVYGNLPNIEVLHAGLECGVIVSKLPGMEAVSIGPLIRNAHTTEEHVFASTVTSTWKLLTTQLEILCDSRYAANHRTLSKHLKL